MSKKLIGKSMEQIKAAVQVVVKRDAISIAEVESIKHFKASFANQGFTDSSLKQWKKRTGDKESDRAILTKTGRLKRSIKTLQKTENSVKIGVDLSEVPYAEIHNTGGIQNVRAHKRRTASGRRSDRDGAYAQVKPHSRKMPKRQFVGDSKVLNDRINNKIIKLVEKELNQ